MHAWARGGKKPPVVAQVREFAGTLDGSTVFAMDTTGPDPHRTYGWDDCHLWHIHISINRRYVNSSSILTIAVLRMSAATRYVRVLRESRKALGAAAAVESAAVGFGLLDSATAGYVTAAIGAATAAVVYLLRNDGQAGDRGDTTD